MRYLQGAGSVLLLLIAVTVFSSTSLAQELVANGSFEAGDTLVGR